MTDFATPLSNAAHSNSSSDELKDVSKDLLRVDTDLTAASTFTTPGSNSNISREWKDFYDGLEKTPPKATHDIQYQAAVEKANKLLRSSDVEGFKNLTFASLDNDQKAIIMFMITKKFDEIRFQGCHSAKILVSALDPGTQRYKNILSFVRQGGDSKCSCPSKVLRHFHQIHESFVKGCPDAKTIFTKNVDMPPCLYMQQECSSICTFSACSALMYYRSYDLQSKPGKGQEVSAIQTNISRYIRDEIEAETIANFTLTTKKGAYLKKILTGLSASFGTGPTDPDCVYLEETESLSYKRISVSLEAGRPLALAIESFPGLGERNEYTGTIQDHYGNNRRPDPGDRAYHAVLCIGIKPRQGEIPPMLLVQDSYPQRPAFSVGLDLLMDMGANTVHLCTVQPTWRPNPDFCYEVTNRSKVFFAGSPMSIKNGEVYILERNQPMPEKRDMSRYLHDPSGSFHVYEL